MVCISHPDIKYGGGVVMKDEQRQTFSNHLAEAIFQMPDIGLVFSRPDTSLFLVNDAICHFFGYTKEELYDIKWPDITHQDDVNKDLRHFTRIRNKEIDSYTIEKRYLRKDGGIFWAEINVKCIWKNEQAIDYFAAVVKDISDRKTTEQRLQNQLDLASHLNDQLQEQKEQLEEYTHILSHDLRSPLVSFQSLMEFFQQSEDPDEREELLEKMNMIAENALETINNISTSLEQDNREANTEHTDFREIINWVKVNLSHQIETTNTLLKYEGNTNIQLPGGRNIYQSIFQNLVSNAIKYRKPNTDPFVNIKAEEVNSNVVLHISDNGQGIDMETHGDQLFERYQTFHEREDAHGIGLYLVKMQVNSLGGSIDVESEVGRGTTFTITIPKK